MRFFGLVTVVEGEAIVLDRGRGRRLGRGTMERAMSGERIFGGVLFLIFGLDQPQDSLAYAPEAVDEVRPSTSAPSAGRIAYLFP